MGNIRHFHSDVFYFYPDSGLFATVDGQFFSDHLPGTALWYKGFRGYNRDLELNNINILNRLYAEISPIAPNLCFQILLLVNISSISLNRV
jgi:hypothetical protein